MHGRYIAESNYDYIITITSEIYAIFLCFYVNYCSFTSIERILLSNFYKARLVIMNFLSSCLCEKVLISPLFLKDSEELPSALTMNLSLFLCVS